jgi:hypothetical protein
LPHWLGFDAINGVTTASMRVIWPTGRVQTREFAAVDDPYERRRRFVVHEGGRY